MSCPKCGSENTETYLIERSQNCLTCGFEFPLIEEDALDLEKEAFDKLIMVWVHEDSKWYYFIDNFDPRQFPSGLVEYTILISNGVIHSDTLREVNVGKLFSECYDIALWQS